LVNLLTPAIKVTNLLSSSIVLKMVERSKAAHSQL
jgi:hypothetical protein